MAQQIKYAIQHSFKREVIIPIAALYHNFEFLYEDKEKEKLVRTSDGHTCIVKKYYIEHICKLEDKIKELYNIDAWSYVKRWYSAIPFMDSMSFLVMELDYYVAKY